MTSPPSVTLVGGSGRSGTTVVNRILAAHPMAAVSPPARFMIDPDGVLPFLETMKHGWTPYAADAALKRLERLLRSISHANWPQWLHPHLRQWQSRFGFNLLPQYAHLNATAFCLDFPRLAEEYINAVKDFSYPAHWVGTELFEKHEMIYAGPDIFKIQQATEHFYRSYVLIAAQGKTAFVDRNTWNHLWFDRFRLIVPEARLVHVYRDPRDVVASFAKQRWMPQDHVYAAQVYSDMMERWWEIQKTLPEHSYLEIGLEELVSNPKEQIEKLVAFMELPWDDAVLSVMLDKANTGRWKTDIPYDVQEKVEDILAPSLRKFKFL